MRGNLEVHTWHKSKVKEISGEHLVIVIGAWKAGYKRSAKDMVLFVDPDFEKGNKVLAMSYTNFCQRIISIEGFQPDNLEAFRRSTKMDIPCYYFRSHPDLKPRPCLAVEKSVPVPASHGSSSARIVSTLSASTVEASSSHSIAPLSNSSPFAPAMGTTIKPLEVPQAHAATSLLGRCRRARQQQPVVAKATTDQQKVGSSWCTIL